MRVAMDAVLEAEKLCEAAICYTGDIFDPARAEIRPRLLCRPRRELEKAGAHIIAVKDMAGVMKPAAARALFKALREEVGAPLHFHTHDTSGLAAATVLAAVEAGVDAVDAAMDSLSGLTSQPCLGSLVAALDQTRPRAPASTSMPSAASRFIGRRCASNTPRSRATSAPAPRRSICTKCPAVSSPT